jgi:hypothetical protein
MSTIRATISANILAKADRLFRNDDAGVFIELLQNSRRAGADLVNIWIDPAEGDGAGSTVIFRDNGRGIEDFQTLLTLGGSGWDQTVQDTEDPAGMGFFSLCHSEVEVASGDKAVVLTRDVFLGKAEAVVSSGREVYVQGTRIIFTRAAKPAQLLATLKVVSEFFPVEVRVNGESLVRHDFLESALHREWIDGIEVGFGTDFRWSDGYGAGNWNFHGLRIRHSVDGIAGLLEFSEHRGWHSQTLEMRFNVLETGRVKLQLPDRHAIVEDEQFREFITKAKAAGYRFLQAKEVHTLPFKDWTEAKLLGVELPEASALLTTWHAAPLDDNLDPLFGQFETKLLADTTAVMLTSRDLENRHTLEAALLGTTFEHELYQECGQFEGYKWYDALPRITETSVLADGVSLAEWTTAEIARPETMELVVKIEELDHADVRHRIPIAIHVQDEEGLAWDDGLDFLAVRNSPWDNDRLAGPFDVVEFLVSATFRASDDVDCDSWETQKSGYAEDVQRRINEYFRGPRAALLALLEDALSWDVKNYAKEVGVREIRFRKPPAGLHGWQVELITEESLPAAA